ncbi:hypothetical protein MMC11_008338 [Xylographa trunciseda]|nr:hypothetical protein [Xylographa trunciseda]
MEKEMVEAADKAPVQVSELESEKQPLEILTDSLPEGVETGTSDPDKNDTKYISGLKLYVMVFALTCIAFLISMNTSVIATVSIGPSKCQAMAPALYLQAIPQITDAFDSIQDIGWYGSAYLLTNCSLLPLSGKIYANHSLMYTYMAFLALFELGSLICGVAISSRMIIAGRAIIGMGAAGLTSGTFTILAASAPLEKRPMLTGIIYAISAVGTLIGPLVGGALAQYVSWRWCFYLNLPCGGAAAGLLLAITVSEGTVSNRKKPPLRTTLQKLDLPGFALFAPACVMFLLALAWGGNIYAWNSATVIGLFCGSFGTICLFFAWEYREKDNAMIPLGMLRRPVVFFSCWTILLQMGALLMLAYYLPEWFQVVQDASPTRSGVLTLPTVCSEIFGAIISGALTSKLGYYTPWAVIGCAFTAIGSGLMGTFTPSTPLSKWVGYQLLAGAGRGMVLQMPITAVQSVLPPAQTAVGSALVLFCQIFGGAVCVTVAQLTLTNSLVPALHAYAPSVDPQDIINAGATNVRAVIAPKDLGGVLLAYNAALTHVFLVAAGIAALAFGSSLGMGWKSIKKAKAKEDAP